MSEEKADRIADNYAERVLRIDGELQGVKDKALEIREADRRLIEQRSDSLAKAVDEKAEALAKQLEDTRGQLEALMVQQRAADQREYREAIQSAIDAGAAQQVLLREMYDAKIERNYEQSRDQFERLEAATHSAIDAVTQKHDLIHAADQKALDKQAVENARRLDELNHAWERQQQFQANSVTRELWQADKDSTQTQIFALDRASLSMTTVASSDKAHEGLATQIETSNRRVEGTVQLKIDNLVKDVADLKSGAATLAGKTLGANALIGLVVAAVTIISAIVITMNVLVNR